MLDIRSIEDLSRAVYTLEWIDSHRGSEVVEDLIRATPRLRSPLRQITGPAWQYLQEFAEARMSISSGTYIFDMHDGQLVIRGDKHNGTFYTDGNAGERREGPLFWFLWRVIGKCYPFTSIVFHQQKSTGKVGAAEIIVPAQYEDWNPADPNPRIYPID